MQLTIWTYEGPPHVGAMRVATSMQGLHYVLHAPQGDTYADLLFTMIERRDHRPPVTYTSFQARDLGADTAELLTQTAARAYERFKPQAMIVGETCTAELIQDQPGALVQGMGLPIPVIALELPSYSKKENWGAAETLYQLLRTLLHERVPAPGFTPPPRTQDRPPRANILGPTALGFRCRDDVTEISRLLAQLGIEVNVVAPLDATPTDLLRIPEADFNIDLYPEISHSAVTWLQRSFKMPYTKTIPIGVGATREFVREVATLAGVDASPILDAEKVGVAALSASQSRLHWYSRSVDSTYLTGKRVFIFGDATHVLAALRIARDEMGFEVVGLGTYTREFAREVRAAASTLGLEALITEDYLEVEACVEQLHPELVLGTQMERHIAKRLGIPCAVISAPVHVQDFPARYAPQMGFEGANVIFDTWIHPLMMGLEEHLLGMFKEDFEFHDQAQPSHLGKAGHTHTSSDATKQNVSAQPDSTDDTPQWAPDAEKELSKIPFFVRGKARRNTERFARERGVTIITTETLYDAKAHFSR